jgi:hypothetical protein
VLSEIARAPPAWVSSADASAAGLLSSAFRRYAAEVPPERARMVAAAAALARRSLAAWTPARGGGGGGGAGAPSAPDIQNVNVNANVNVSGATRMLDTGGQRSPEWMERRKRLLTASSFANALGFFGGARITEAWVRAAARVHTP